METTGINKTVYRNDVISALDSFTSVRNVLAWEMFQDGQVRNYDGVINDLQRLYPDIDFDSVTENINPESIATDENAIYALVDNIINKLIESGIPKDNFNYAIWACDDPENVADTYGVDIDDVSAYKITNGILLQDLGYEGQLYGVAEYPEEEWDVIESALKGGNMETREDYKDYYLEQLIENYGNMTERDYNSAQKFCYDEEWNLGEVGNMAEAIDGLGDAWTEYQKQYKEGFEIMNSKNISSANNIPDDPTKVPPVPPVRPIPNKPPKREDDTPPSPKRIRDKYGKSFKDYLDEELEKNNASNSLKRTIKSSGRWVVKTNEDQMDYIGNFFEGLPSCPQYVDWGYDEEKYAKAVNDSIFGWMYEDSDFSEADKKKITRNFLKLYKDYYNNGEPKDDLNTYYFEGEGPSDPRLIEWLHSVLSDKELNVPFTTWHYVESSKKNIKSSKAEELEMFENESVYGNESEFNDFKKNHPDFTITYLDWKKYLNGYEDDVPYEFEDENGNMYTWDMIKTEIDNWVDSGDFEEQNGALPEYFEKDGTPKYKKIYDDFWDISSNGAFSRINSSRRNNMKKTIKSSVRDHYLLGKQNFLTEHVFGIDDDGDVEYEYDFGEELVDAEMSIFENSDTGFVGFDIESHQAGKTKTRHEVLDYDGLENKIEGSDIKNGVAIYEDSNGVITVATMGSNWHNSKTGEEGTDYTLFKAVDYNAEPEDEEIESSRKPIKSSKWVEDVADKKGITFDQVLEVFKDNGYGEDEADDFWNSKWNDVSDAFGEDGIAGLDELFGIEITSAHKSIKSSSMIYKENEMPSVMKDRIYWEIYYYNEGDDKELGTQNRYDSVRGMSFTQAKRRAKQLMKDYNCDTACMQTTGGNGVIIKNDPIGDKNMKIQSKRLIKSGPGAGYDITVRGIELDNHNWKILKDDYEERYGSHTVQVEIPVKPCVAEYWAAEAYYDGIDSKHDMYDGNWDSQIDGGTAILQMEVYPEYTDDVLSQEELDEAIGNLLPSELDLTMMYGGGWSHVNLPEEGIDFDDDNGRINLDEGETYDYTTVRCELKCPNITQNINAFFKNPDAYYDEDGMPQYPEDDIE